MRSRYCSMIYFFFQFSTLTVFNATLHDDIAVKLGYDLSPKCLFLSKSTFFFFLLKVEQRSGKQAGLNIYCKK